MPDRPVHLIVHHASACGLLKPGERWLINGREALPLGKARLCAFGLCSVHPKLVSILAQLSSEAPLPDDLLLCDHEGCDVAFRMEFATAKVPLPGADTGKMTRRMERGAMAATNILKKQGPFLARVSKELAATLISACTTTRYDDGQIVLMQGVVGEHLYLVAEGTVEVARFGKDADETVLVTLGVGECFGEMSILTGEVTSAEVRSRGRATILSLHKEQLEAMLLQTPELSREFSKLLADRLKATNVSLESELSRGVLGKLSMISFVDLVQTLHQSRRTGTLVLNCAGQQARVGFHNGAVSTAVVGAAQGDEAFLQIVSWPDGDFCFEANQSEDVETGKVESDTLGLMMEGMRRLDEAKAAESSGALSAEKGEVQTSSETK
jgi:CRP-like cAMP-binding protein